MTDPNTPTPGPTPTPTPPVPTPPSTGMPPATPTPTPTPPAAPVPLPISKGKDQIYKAAAQVFIREVTEFLARDQRAYKLGDEFYQNAHTSRGEAGSVIAKYKVEFADREAEFIRFFTERFQPSNPPGLAKLFDKLELDYDFFSDVSDPQAPTQSYNRIDRALSWITYFEELL